MRFLIRPRLRAARLGTDWALCIDRVRVLCRHNCRVPGMEFLSASASAASGSAKIVQNVKHCPQCFCFVCDGPVRHSTDDRA